MSSRTIHVMEVASCNAGGQRCKDLLNRFAVQGNAPMIDDGVMGAQVGILKPPQR